MKTFSSQAMNLRRIHGGFSFFKTDHMKRRTLIALLVLAIALNTAAQLPAFPGAQGAGMFATGGRGSVTVPTTVFEVTNLGDINTPGSLRYACSQSVTTYPNRTIVFKTSGTIHLTSKLTIPKNTTLAGQTAPGGGICIADYPVVIGGDGVIIRYLRFRMGDRYQLKTSPASCGVPVAPFTAACMPLDGSGGDDALGNLGNKQIIIDHCSISWSSDEALTVYRGDSVTMQWNLVSEPLNYSYHFETGDTDFEQHGYGGIWGSRNGSFHHNLIAHCRNRTPRFAGVSTYSNPAQGAEMVDFRNNVIYNWGINNVYGGEGGYYNMVNNYLKAGPSTSNSRKTQVVAIDSGGGYPYAKYFLEGNYISTSAANTAKNWMGVSMKSGNLSDTSLSKVTTAFSLPPVTMQAATDAYTLVLARAGAHLPLRDTLDQRVINNVINGTGAIIDVQGGFSHGTPYAQTINAWPTLAGGTVPTDSDNDGMPDAWEAEMGLNGSNATDRNGIGLNGYTNLENYLNSLAADAIITYGNLTAFTQGGTTASAVQSYSLRGQNLSGDLMVRPPAGFEVSINNTTWFTASNPLVLPVTNGTLSLQTVYLRLNAVSAGNYTGALVHSTAIGTSVSIGLQGTAGTATSVIAPVAPSFAISPNPVREELRVKHGTATASLVVYSIDGREILQQQTVPGTKETIMDLRLLRTGAYLLRFQTKSGFSSASFQKLP